MKFVFALALVAVCVMLMHARPNVKRDAGDKVGGHKHGGEKADVADALSKLRKHGGEKADVPDDSNKQRKSGGERKYETKNNGKPDFRQGSETEGDKEEEKEADHPDEATGDGSTAVQDKRRKRAATDIYTVQPWPKSSDGSVDIPYRFEEDLPDFPGVADYGETKKCPDCDLLKVLVEHAVDEWNAKTGLNLHLDQSASGSVINIRPPRNEMEEGCWSYIGHQGNGNDQIVLSAYGCHDKGVILHEFGHAIGLIHEAKREDAPEHIKVVDSNIKTGYENQFTTDPDAKPMHTYILHADAYDYCSIMHYSNTAFSSNGDDTLEFVGEDAFQSSILLPCLGSQIELSLRDGIGVAELYGTLASEAEAASRGCKYDGYALAGGTGCICSNLFEGSQCETPISDSTCGESVLNLDAGELKTFKTPNYPSAYPVNTECTWAVNLEGSASKLCIAFPNGYDIEPASLGAQATCAFDWYELIISELLTIKTKRHCGKDEEGWYQVLKKEDDLYADFAAIVFNSDDMETRNGFKGAAYGLSEDEDEEDCAARIAQEAEFNTAGASVDALQYYSGYLYYYYYYYY